MTILFKVTLKWLLALSVLQLGRSQDADTGNSTKIIESFHIKSDIRFRFATTQMVSVVRNVGDEAQEIAFDVTLPKEAFIVNFSMAIDGKDYVGEVKEKNAAKRQYQSAVDKGQSAGHIRQAPRHSNVFEVSVNVANGSAVTFTLTYQELLKRKHGVYEHEIHVNPGQAVDDFSIEIFIQENREIPFVRTPALRTDVLLSNSVEEENELAFIERPTPKTAHVMYAPTLKQQGDGGVTARFAIQYDVEHTNNGEVLVVDGYFLHFYAPEIPPLPKDIIFVLDVSGSMSGQKINQLKTSMVTILKDLNPEDRFNILTFSHQVSKWKRGLTVADSSVIQEAIGFVREMRADGSTNINDALLKALSELRGRELTQRVGMIFFLTDGQPTAGVTNTNQITTNVRNSNENFAAIFGLAFGTGADFDFLKTMCGQNSGFARKIYEASDSALQVASLYDEISAVVMKDVKVEYLPGIKKTTQKEFPVVFNGTEIVICGPFDRDLNKFVAKVSGIEKSGEVDVILDIDDLSEVTISVDDSLNTFFTMPRDYVGIVEKMWAFLTIKQLLKEKERVVQDETKAEQLKKEILAMSLKYNFVTPLTSMVVTKPGEKDKKFESGLEDVDKIPVMRASNMISGTGLASYPMAKSSIIGGHGPTHFGSRSFYNTPSAGFYPRRHQTRQYIPRGYRMTQTARVFTTTFTMPTTTTTTTTTFTTSTKAPTTGPFPILSSLLVRSMNSSSVCIAPRKLVKGTYSLLVGLNGKFKIEIGTDCVKKCRLILADSLNLTYNGDKAFINLGSARTWRYSQGQNFTIRLVGRNQLNIQTPLVDTIITRRISKRRVLYGIEFVMKTRDNFSGLLARLQRKALKRKFRKSKVQVPRSCQNKQADLSLKLNRKFARRFMKQSSP